MATAIQAPAIAEGPTSHTQNQPEPYAYSRQEQKDALARLREPFKPEEILQRPEIVCDDCERHPEKVCPKHHLVRCSGCGQTVTVAHTDLSYVGHAEATERLLDVDPFWGWAPVAVDAHGLPMLDDKGGLWIRLTVVGVSRLGYGSGGGRGRGGSSVKELIGNAIRNAGMRFGMALDLWKKSDQRLAADADRVAVGLPQAPDLRLGQLATWSRTHWDHLDKLTAIHGWVTGEGFAGSLIPGPGNNLLPIGPLLEARIAELGERPAPAPAGSAPHSGSAPVGEHNQDTGTPVPGEAPDAPHTDEPTQDGTDVLDKMTNRVFLHWHKPLLLEQDRTEARRLDLLDHNVEGPKEWDGEWMALGILIDRRLDELNAAPAAEADDTGRSAA